MISKGTPFKSSKEDSGMNNCLCNLFDDNWIWLIIIALILIFCCCGGSWGNNSCGCDCGHNNSNCC